MSLSWMRAAGHVSSMEPAALGELPTDPCTPQPLDSSFKAIPWGQPFLTAFPGRLLIRWVCQPFPQNVLLTLYLIRILPILQQAGLTFSLFSTFDTVLFSMKIILWRPSGWEAEGGDLISPTQVIGTKVNVLFLVNVLFPESLSPDALLSSHNQLPVVSYGQPSFPEKQH